jgi:protein-S-isoprenylcysteine O-methyltransferase Ste14
VIWVVSWMIAALWSAREVNRLPLRLEIPSRLWIIGGSIVLFFLWRRQPLWHPGLVFRWIMLIPTLAGFAFTWWARIHLGALWSAAVTRRDGHRVIDTGPYGLVRHPIYTGVILAGFATALAETSLVALAGVAAMTYGWVLKARLEESWLRAELGPAYDAYAARVPMLVPRLERKR